MTTGILAGVGGSAVLILTALYFGLVATTVMAPFVMVSIARSLRGIQRELEYVNRRGLSYEPPAHRQALAVPEPAAARDLGHQLLR